MMREYVLGFVAVFAAVVMLTSAGVAIGRATAPKAERGTISCDEQGRVTFDSIDFVNTQLNTIDLRAHFIREALCGAHDI